MIFSLTQQSDSFRIPVNCHLLKPAAVKAAMPEATAAMAFLAQGTTAAAVAVMALEAEVVPTIYQALTAALIRRCKKIDISQLQ